MCPSEVSDIDSSIAPEYGPRGVEVWALGVYDPERETSEAIFDFAESLDLSVPVLLDDGTASTKYPLATAFPSAAFPRQFVVGVDGTVVYVNNRYEADSLIAVLEAELDR